MISLIKELKELGKAFKMYYHHKRKVAEYRRRVNYVNRILSTGVNIPMNRSIR